MDRPIKKAKTAIALFLAFAFCTAGQRALAAPAAAPAAAVDAKLAQDFADAVFMKKPEDIKKMLDQTPALANAEANYALPLQKAADKGSLEIVQLLVAHGADAKLKNSQGTGPLFNAAASGKIEVVKFLAEKGADAKAEPGLLGAAQTGEMAEFLITLKLDPKAKDPRGNTALHTAAEWGRKDVIDVLLKHGADIEAAGGFNRRPIHVAAGSVFTDSRAIVEYLISKGADPKSKGFIGGTALHEAAFHGQLKAAEFLIGKGLDVNQPNDNKQTPLDLAKQANQQPLIDLLKKHGAKG